jgi:60Kd inner membrane protein
MNTGKLLNIILLAGIMTLAMQFFLPKNSQNGAIVQSIYLQAKKESVTIPNIPIIEVVNEASGVLSIHPCSDLKITIDSRPLTGIQETMPKFCEALTVTSGSKNTLPLKELYTVFASTQGKYILSLSGSFGERIVTFNMESPSAIRELLSTTIYQPIYNFFVALITFLPGHSLGWAIIIITLIIRLILLVPQNHMLQSQKKLQLLQPQIKKLQAEHREDQATLGMKMLELYKKE